MKVSVKSGETMKPELFVSGWPSLEEGEGMISVREASLLMNHVDVELVLSPSLIFVVVVNGTLTVESSSFVGSSPSLSSTFNSEPITCSWLSGAFFLKNSTTKLVSSSFSHLASGALNMKGGNLSVESSSFFENTQNHPLFHSARRNIHCSDGGIITIGSLNGGDGSSEKHPHLWLSHDNCVLNGEDVNANAPLFIRTLSETSTSTLNKTSKAFDLRMEGTTLIPCSLFLEVFETKKDETVGKTIRIGLSEDSTDSFNETEIKMSVPVLSMAGFEKSLEWSGRLVYGLNETTSSFVIQFNSMDRASQAARDNMKWWIPLVVSLVCLLIIIVIVVVIFWHRRKQASKMNSSKADLEPQEMMMDKIEDCDVPTVEMVNTSSARGLNGNTRFAAVEGQEPTRNDNAGEMDSLIPETDRVDALCVTEEKFETVVVNKRHTLYEKLHVEKMGIDRVRVGQMIVRGLAELARRNQTSTGLRLSSHMVLFSESGEVCLRVKGEKEDMSEFGEKGKSDVRWRSPEQKNESGLEGDVEPEQVTVFRLGLVLYEIETGHVPFGETDEVNASRALHAGTVPKMEGVGEEMQKLIVSCLSVTPGTRPSLSTIGSQLKEIGKPVG
ncbi:hypothetical protein BLNAU_18789 [Blattamonas nauphoetae]|uniref:Serine-threonine/tyrosine-protein kinase catalytic domain-containing protein n=1 Tax=Blattamonas nauphoetae TaxID=2049346 RepID=A0ABQ9X3C8_9EUKA|nr:hypothetical protein BLNAU_18789 [Blattamonas nauphoetae]